MPPKGKPSSSSSAPVDKTFGLKNRNKSARVQKYVEQVQKQQSMAGKSKKEIEKEHEKQLRAQAKADKEKLLKEEAALSKPVQVQKVPFGVDPKTLLCEFFKASQCTKGSKCKFSHDVNVGRKVDKKNLYEDAREEKMKDTMEGWDEEKLRSVTLSKHGNPRTTTDIVCKHFIEAIETSKYGWFWECPNGGEKCQYRHALPPGFVLKSQKKAVEDLAKANTISLEEFLEVERHKLGSNLTPVTLETFATWKKTRMNKKLVEEEAKKKAKDSAAAAGKSTGMSGKDLFTYNPEWFVDDGDEGAINDDYWDLDKYRRETEAARDAAEAERVAGFQIAEDDAYREGGGGTG